MKTFDQFVNENYEPLGEVATCTIKGQNYSFKVKNLYDFIRLKNYNVVDLNVKEVGKFGNFDDDNRENLLIRDKITLKWIKYDDLPKDKQKEFDDRENIRIDSTNLKYPIIVCINDKKEYNIMDGNHRLKKAQKLHKETIKAHIIPEQEIIDSIKTGDFPANILEQFSSFENLANDFLTEKGISIKYLNSENRDGMCWWFAKNFSKYLDSKNIENAVVDMRHKNMGGNHLVVKVKDNFIDFTERSAAGKFPAVLKKTNYNFDIFKEYDSFEDFYHHMGIKNEHEWKNYEEKSIKMGDFKKPENK